MTLEHILVATDFSEPSERALDLAVELATQFDAALTVVHVVEVPSYVYTETTYASANVIGPLNQAARERLDGLIARTRERLPRAQALLRSGTPWEEVLGAARDTTADLVVVGTHGRRGVKHLLIGSVAEKIVRTSPVPVLSVRAEQKT
jgi:nucleotide-binding universal stress UspA family protein